ncbi:hypothetical protein LTR97_012120 [Elasticomyces elasticus]|uniref:Uncharacterized protein n=1 Tax=Elasticomyces elasticus TaxID=574655 RepID=A0AAN7VW15_9PEZI|nr:hypothetical protein LTR97_012120 [Elasticomyces elasticus]
MYNDTHRRAYGYGMQGHGDGYGESSRGSSRSSQNPYNSGRGGQQFHGVVEDDSIHSDDSDLRRGLRRARGETKSVGVSRVGRGWAMRNDFVSHAAALRAHTQRQEQVREREFEQQRLREEELRRERLREEQLRQERAYSDRGSTRERRRRSYPSVGSRYDYDAEDREPSRGGRDPPRRRYYGEDSDSEDGYGGGWGGGKWIHL